MPAIESVWWDLDDEPEGNMQHGVTRDEVDEVLSERSNSTYESHSSG